MVMIETSRVFNINTTVSSVISAGGIFILWRQITSEHEKSRREKAIMIMRFYITEYNEEMGMTRQLSRTR